MAFWNSKMPGYIYDCHYEKLVNDPVEETKKLIQFCNLEWDENCLDHTKNKTGIIYVLDKNQFHDFIGMECKCEKELKPIEVIRVNFDDLPKNIKII